MGTGIPLAVGDVFTAGDYKVTITEITSGGQTGYNGKGYVEQMKLIGLPVAKQVAVTLENTVVNDCYELAGGRVISAYDPNWGGVLDGDLAISDFKKFIEDLGNTIDNVKNWANNFDGAIEDQEAAAQYIEELKSYKEEIFDDGDYSLTEINTITSEINALIGMISGVANANPSARISATALDKPATKTQAAKVESSFWKPILVFLCSENAAATPYTFDGKTGIIPACTWQSRTGIVDYLLGDEIAFGCGLLDGFYVNVVDKIENVGQFVSCVKELVDSALPGRVDNDLKSCRKIAGSIVEPVKMIYGIITNTDKAKQAWEGVKKEARKYGGILTCTGAFTDSKTCAYARGHILGDHVADFVTGVAAYKVFDTAKKVLKTTKVAGAIEVIEKVDNVIAQVGNSVTKFGKARMKKLANGVSRLVVDGVGEVLEYAGGKMKVLVSANSKWLTSGTSGWTFVTEYAGTYYNNLNVLINNGKIKVYKKVCGGSNLRSTSSDDICEIAFEGIKLLSNWVKMSKKKFPLCKPETRTRNPKWCDIRDAAERFQKRVTGLDSDVSFDVECNVAPCKSGKVSFDGFDDATNTLKEAKYGYGDEWFLDDGDGNFEIAKKINMYNSLLLQAKRQVEAIRNKPELKIEWYCSNDTAAGGIRTLFENDPLLKPFLDNSRLIIKKI